jgi:hypothetical protein
VCAFLGKKSRHKIVFNIGVNEWNFVPCSLPSSVENFPLSMKIPSEGRWKILIWLSWFYQRNASKSSLFRLFILREKQHLVKECN